FAAGLSRPSRTAAKWRRRRDAAVREMTGREMTGRGMTGQPRTGGSVMTVGGVPAPVGSATRADGELVEGSSPRTLNRSARRARRLVAAR
ncbi:hypothetical protein, partial [Alienimonas chondri]|uniref:hypothetical protein n=1 Tax=Alienimonas chondri TaxID=2681879 RepID=UPI0019D6A95E